MRIAYVAVGVNLELGVGRKLLEQMGVWVDQGHDARLFLQGHEPPARALPERVRQRVEAVVDRPVRAGPAGVLDVLRRTSVLRRLLGRVRQWEPDVIYLRFGMAHPALSRLARRVPTVVEVNSDDLAEFGLRLSWHRILYHKLARGALLRAVHGMAFVAEELAELDSFRRFGKPAFVTGNGLDLEGVLPLPPVDGGPEASPRLFFLGSPGLDWHGVDKIAELAARNADWTFDLVGYTEADFPGARPDNVACHGPLPAREYRAIAAGADVALGTLALHRKNMHEASPLKVREYLAMGLPTIIGYRDTDFPDGAEFLLRLPNREDNVTSNLGEIRAFVERMMGRRVARSEIAHLDVRRKETERLAFLQRLLEGEP